MPSTVAPAGAAAWAAAAVSEVAQRHDYLLLLSHMRSYSSLLAHLLGSSPDVDGYGETLLRYRSRIDLWRLRRSIRAATGKPLRGRWLLDKVLHNHVRPLDRWLAAERVRAVMFVRQPEPTLQSLLTLARQQNDGPFLDDPQRCCDYYVARLHRLREDAQRLGNRALYFDAELLVERPHAVLAGLAQALGLHQPLEHDYAVGKRSGEVGFGDPSDNIRSGHILPASASTVRRRAVLPPAVLAEAEAAYRRCRAVLLQRCRVLAA